MFALGIIAATIVFWMVCLWISMRNEGVENTNNQDNIWPG